MGKRGRPTKPTVLKIREGNPGKQKLPANEPKPPVGTPTCPDWLGDVGRAKWESLVRLLGRVPGLLTEADADALGLYAHTYEIFLEALREIEANGGPTCTGEKGGKYPHPADSRRKQAVADMLRIGARFGMTPSDRAGINLLPAAGCFDK